MIKKLSEIFDEIERISECSSIEVNEESIRIYIPFCTFTDDLSKLQKLMNNIGKVESFSEDKIVVIFPKIE